MELNPRPKVPNLAIINSLFIVKVNLPNFLVNRQQFASVSIITDFNSHTGFAFKMLLQNYRNQPSNLNKHTNFNAATLDKQCATNNILFSQPLSLTLSHPHNNHTPTTISPLNTISLRQPTFDCHSATKFSAKWLIFPSFPPHFIRCFASKPHHTTCPQTIPVWL